jgi:hypothetical protein
MHFAISAFRSQTFVRFQGKAARRMASDGECGHLSAMRPTDVSLRLDQPAEGNARPQRSPCAACQAASRWTGPGRAALRTSCTTPASTRRRTTVQPVSAPCAAGVVDWRRRCPALSHFSCCTGLSAISDSSQADNLVVCLPFGSARAAWGAADQPGGCRRRAKRPDRRLERPRAARLFRRAHACESGGCVIHAALTTRMGAARFVAAVVVEHLASSRNGPWRAALLLPA